MFSPWGSVLSERPLRLLHVRTMTSVEPGIEATDPPEYNILSFTWGRWKSDAERPIQVEGTNWKAPAVRPEHFSPEDFQRVLRAVSQDVDYVWVDIACINQGRKDEDIAERMDQIGKQMGIFSGATKAYVWLSRSSKADLEESLGEMYGYGQELIDQLSQIRETNEPLSTEEEQSILDLVEDNTQAFRSFCSDPWFSSLWTLQESVLRRDAIILSREGETLDDGGTVLSLAMVGNFYRNVLKTLNRHLVSQHRFSSRIDQKILDLRDELKSNVLAFMVCSNPNVAYSLARHRTCERQEDQIYGIMQVYGLRLGKTDEPLNSFTLQELEDQFSCQVNHAAPCWLRCLSICRLPELAGVGKSQENQRFRRHLCLTSSNHEKSATVLLP